MKKTTAFVYALLLILSGLFFSGCGADDLRSGDEDGADCGKVFCLGILLTETESFNKHLREAVSLAKEDIKNAGESIEIISVDFHAGESEAEASAMRLHEMGVRAIVGPSFSSDSLEAFDFINEKKIATISPSATSPEITERNKGLINAGEQNYFFRVSPSDLLQAPILAGKITGNNVVIVYRDDTWGRGLSGPLKEFIEGAGKTVKEIKYPTGMDEFPGAQKVVEDVETLDGIEGADSIVALVFSEGEGIVKGLLASGTVPDKARYYVGDGFLLNAGGFFPLGEKEKAGAAGGFTNITSSPLPEKRLDKFKERFSDDAEKVGSFAAHAYDATVILRLAALADPENPVSEIRNVSESGHKCYSYAQCAASLKDETETNDDINYEGLSGPIAFDENGDIKSGFYAVYTYDKEGNSEVEYLDFDGNPVP